MKTFPIMRVRGEEQAKDFAVETIPFALIAPHERQAQKNHRQTLARLAERGGLSPSEALAVLEDRRRHPIPAAEARKRLAAKVEAFFATG